MLRLAAAACLAVLPATAQAHSFGQLYNLPVPLWLYTWGASAALLLSFLVAGWFLTQPLASAPPYTRVLGAVPSLRGLRIVSFCLLLLCIATGLFGTRNAYLNFSMTWFWIVFVLGFSYLTALCGNLYPIINPLRLLTRPTQHRWQLSERWGVWPALTLYGVFIWLELFGRLSPAGLAWMLLGYLALTWLGCWAFGVEHWLRQGEIFTVFLRLIAHLAPLDWQAPTPAYPTGRLLLRWPGAGLLNDHARDFSEVVFVLFMLSSTAFDGLHATRPWAELFWVEIRALLAPMLTGNIALDYPTLKPIHGLFETLALIFSPWVYCLLYAACLWMAQKLTRTTRSVGELMRRFAWSLLPIALVYHLTHYGTLLITQGVQILRLISDPFGWGWNLFGTALWLPTPLIPDMNWVWHSQAGLIVLGHIASVIVAHLEALRLFGSSRLAMLSQIPMLGLMMGFTTIGLWILAQPISESVAG